MQVAVSLAIGALGGAYIGASSHLSLLGCRVALLAALVGTLAAHASRWSRTAVACATVVFLCGGALLAGKAREEALATSLRAVLDAEFGGFELGTLGPEGEHPPVVTRGLLAEDASAGPPVAQLRLRVLALRIDEHWVPVDGGVSVSVAGNALPDALAEWRAGRTIVAPVSFRRPASYLDPGVPDFEHALAMSGTTLFGSVKSGFLVEVESAGSWRQERAADARAIVRQAVARWVRPHGEVSAAVVSAILIGDRTGLPDEIRERLQAAGVYHVLAISGGNIAILVGVILIVCRCLGLAGRASMVITLGLLLFYAQIVVAGPSVFRALVTAWVYLVAKILDHRTPPWQAIAVAAAMNIAVDPLDVINAGFVLTFAATAALLGAVPYVTALRRLTVAARWLLGALLASVATEVVLLPIGAAAFGRITGVGILLNLVAIPLMTIVQFAGFALSLGVVSETMGQWAGWVSHLGASALVESARLVDVLPWLTARVPPPPAFLALLYYGSAAGALFLRGVWRRLTAVAAVIVAWLIVSGAWLLPEARPASELQLTMFDVGQGEAMRLAWPGGGSMVVDTGGVPFGGGGFDIGDRVLRPALWAQGVRRVERLLVTHGDPDHIGGAPAVMESFRPRFLFEGIPVPGNTAFERLRNAANARGAAIRQLRAGDTWTQGDVVVRVLSPEPPDWERRRVRNDDSVVLEVRYGDVAILMTGDAGADVERAILPRLSDAPIRVLKVGHHGSHTSTSAALIDGWKPQVALISCGRGNRFGHPAPDVVSRLARAGATTYRTDRDGAITLATDGTSVRVTTYLP
jgi:competence protein ComEC